MSNDQNIVESALMAGIISLLVKPPQPRDPHTQGIQIFYVAQLFGFAPCGRPIYKNRLP